MPEILIRCDFWVVLSLTNQKNIPIKNYTMSGLHWQANVASPVLTRELSFEFRHYLCRGAQFINSAEMCSLVCI